MTKKLFIFPLIIAILIVLFMGFLIYNIYSFTENKLNKSYVIEYNNKTIETKTYTISNCGVNFYDTKNNESYQCMTNINIKEVKKK
jgi:uncharacterized membrane protein SpoIIM required for sporulation